MASQTALLIIDVQVALVGGAYREIQVLDTINGLIASARQAAVPIIHVQHNHSSFDGMKKGSPGWAVDPRLDYQPQDLRVEKEASDAFYQSDLQAQLEGLGTSLIAVTGLQTEYCVDTTCRAALSRGFDVVLAADGHTTGPAHLQAADIITHHNALLQNLAHPDHHIRVIAADEIVFS